ANGGKVPPIRRFGGSPMIEEEAFKLKAGELSGIVSVDGQFIILRCQGRTKPVQTDFKAVRGEVGKGIQEKKLRLLITKEFERLREVAQVDNFLAGTSQSGNRSASPVAITPNGPPAAQRAGAGLPQGGPGMPGAAAPRTGALSPAGAAPGSAAMPRPV